MNAKTNARPP
jgi:hypothetical protein